jgi:hypothetical protein
MIHILLFFIIGVPWRDIEDIKIDNTVPYKVPNHQFNITFFYVKLNRMNYLLVIYDTQSGITIETRYVWVA